MDGRPQVVQAQAHPQHADCAQAKVRAKPKKNRRVKNPGFKLDPAERQSKKRQGETNRDRTGQAKKPSVRKMTLAPQSSRRCQCENPDGHCHHHEQACKNKKAKWASPEEWDQSVCAQSKAIQNQKPRSVLSRTPNAGYNAASA